MVFDIVWSLVFWVVPCVTVLGVASLFLRTLWQALQLVDPKHRRLAPGLVWVCLIPVAGNVAAVWMVGELAASLRNQFQALGKLHRGESYGRVTGRIWTCSLIITELLAGAAVFFPDWSKPMVFAIEFFGVLFLVTWLAHWAQINEYKLRLQKHVDAMPRTQEELDYGDDITPPQEE